MQQVVTSELPPNLIHVNQCSDINVFLAISENSRIIYILKMITRPEGEVYVWVDFDDLMRAGFHEGHYYNAMTGYVFETLRAAIMEAQERHRRVVYQFEGMYTALKYILALTNKMIAKDKQDEESCTARA